MFVLTNARFFINVSIFPCGCSIDDYNRLVNFPLETVSSLIIAHLSKYNYSLAESIHRHRPYKSTSMYYYIRYSQYGNNYTYVITDKQLGVQGFKVSFFY